MQLHPSLEWGLGQLRARLSARGVGMRVLETVRPPERQAELYAQGRTRPGRIVTHARPWESAHQWGLAADTAPIPDTAANWKVLRQEARLVGFRLIGEWDPGHLEHPSWPKVLAALRQQWRR